MPEIVVADRLVKRYGSRHAVRGVSFTIEEGEIIGLLGPNGSGKSTILRMLAGYLQPTAGSLRIAGVDVVSDSLAARRQVGYVPEDAPLYQWMSVRDSLTFMARLRGLGGESATRSIDTAIERFALGDVRRTLVGKLSRGYRQRVAIAQALLGNPAVLILDEPTNGLDPRQIIEMRGHIRTLARECTIIVTSHILGEIERVADRVAILLEGRLLDVHVLRTRNGPARIRLRVRGSAAAVHACLGKVPGVRDVSIEGNSGSGLAVGLVEGGPDTETLAERLASAIIREGFGLRGIGPADSDLESLFLRLTGGQPERQR